MKRVALTLGTSLLLMLFLYGFISGCAPGLPPATAPENYKGPIAEAPIGGSGGYWIYERGDGRKVKFRAGTFVANQLANLSFPLWVGMGWSYRGEPGKKVMPPKIDCEVVDFKQIAVTAGTFGAFECRCQCRIPGYERDCGQWSVWYAPEVENIIKTKTQSTRTIFELLQYEIPELSELQD